MAIDRITSETELDDAKKNNKSCVVMFTAAWSGVSEPTKQTFERNSSKYPNTYIGWVDIDSNPELATKYQVTAIPYVLGYKEASQVGQYTGPMIVDNQVTSFIEKTL